MKNENLFTQLDDADLVGQLLCYDIYDKDDPKEVEEILAAIRPGGIFLTNLGEEKVKLYTEMANKYTKVPVIVVADVERGPGEHFCGKNRKVWPTFPEIMAWGACDDEKLIEEGAREIAKFCRLKGIHWTLAPVVDINMNLNNPLVNTRAASDSGKQVSKIMGAFVRGIQKDGYMVATAKHFPGDGVDDRNQHFCTSVNSLSMEQWWESFGQVYKDMISEGVASVMTAHIALPAYANEKDQMGYIPGTLSKPLMTDLLKGELGFDGCIISDAMCMVGVSSRIDLNKLALTFINDGGDMILFNEPEDHGRLLKALQDGTLSRERLLDAVGRVLEVKKKARLFENQEDVLKEITETEEELIEKINQIGSKIAERSIKFVRDYTGILPLKTDKKMKFLSVEVKEKDTIDTSVIAKELEKRGHQVDVVYEISHRKLNEILDDYDCILINYFHIIAHGGSNRLGWDQMMYFWRGYVLKHPKLVVTAFGDPYKLYDFPFIKTHINTFSYTENSLRAFVEVLLGEKEMVAKNPVALAGEFERETL